jgi:hypothetical protein
MFANPKHGNSFDAEQLDGESLKGTKGQIRGERQKKELDGKGKDYSRKAPRQAHSLILLKIDAPQETKNLSSMMAGCCDC